MGKGRGVVMTQQTQETMIQQMEEKPAEEKPVEVRALPKPIMRKMRWPYLLVWIVPLLAAIAAGFYMYEYFQQRGREITITFFDGSGIKESESKVMHRGVEVGEVTGIELGADKQQ